MNDNTNLNPAELTPVQIVNSIDWNRVKPSYRLFHWAIIRKIMNKEDLSDIYLEEDIQKIDQRSLPDKSDLSVDDDAADGKSIETSADSSNPVTAEIPSTSVPTNIHSTDRLTRDNFKSDEDYIRYLESQIDGLETHMGEN